MFLRLISFTLMISFLSSCINKKMIHGNLPDPDIFSILKVGKDDKSSVSKILGDPSFKGTLGDNSFYYFGSVNTKVAFLKPNLKEQIVVELKFDKSNILKKIYYYDKNQTENFDMSSLETKAISRKPNIFKQILGNIGVPGMRRGGPIIGSGRADD